MYIVSYPECKAFKGNDDWDFVHGEGLVAKTLLVESKLGPVHVIQLDCHATWGRNC